MSDSILDLVRKDLEELSKDKFVNIPVKGYEASNLSVRYRYPESGRELDMLAEKIQRETKDKYSRGLLVSMDTMILLCDGIYVQPDGVEEPVMLDPDETGHALTFSDPSLSTVVGLNGDAPSARNTLKKLFGDNDIAIMNHAEKLQRWVSDTKADLNAELWQVALQGEL